MLANSSNLAGSVDHAAQKERKKKRAMTGFAASPKLRGRSLRIGRWLTRPASIEWSAARFWV